ncbi:MULTISPECIES: methyl-accepting chemotaxis protein [unclassified Marinobacter]|uniref:methyl-accepting chemotaxis protein n=1 Tax=unclassified Marinobacter TaxID=83889 RepID=UPI001D116A5B|nr:MULTISPECIES: methyl-accepting chemotaxis protein [unclassified Marinobacter]
MASSFLESAERKLGVPGKLLIAPVFVLLLFASVTFFSVSEFQQLDQRMNTVARDLAPDTAIGTESVISVYRMRLRVSDYYATGHEETLERFDELEADFNAVMARAQENIQEPERAKLVDRIENTTKSYIDAFRNELVPAKRQVLAIIDQKLDEHGPNATKALRLALNGVANREPDSELRAGLEQLLNDALIMRMTAERYLANGDEDSKKALGWAIEDLSDALELIDAENGPEFVQVYLNTVVEELGNYRSAVQEMLKQQSILVEVKTQKLDALGREIATMARDLEASIFASLEIEADEATAETDLALKFTLAAFAVSAVLGLIVAVVMSRLMGSSVKRAKTEILGYLDDIANNNGDLSTRLTPGRPDEIGDFIGAVNTFLETLEETISRIVTASRRLTGESESLAGITARTTANSEQQRDQITQVSAAMQEMVSTSEEIASNTSDTDESARKASSLADSGQETVGSAIRAVTNLANQVEKGSTRIQQLENESAEIGNVLAVIQSIAEQTNLLALNAAIEAARAGEAGRGFAVVADEVRGLARRVQESTVDIERIVSQLQSGAAGAVVDMSKAKQMAEEASEEASKSGEALTDILAAVNSIVEMTTQIASATEQQRATAAEMTQNVEISSGAIEELAGDISQVNQSSRSLADMADELNTLVRRFRANET